MKTDIYNKITEEIIKELENNNLKWFQSWKIGFPKNHISKKDYKGINALLLNLHLNKHGFTKPYYLTFNQIKNLKGMVKKGSKGQYIIYYKMMQYKNINKETNKEELKKVPLLRYYYVFNIEQTTLKIKEDIKPFNPIKECETIIKDFKNKPEIKYNIGKAFYRIKEDFISIPEKSLFNSEPEYYSTLFHELVHSTGIEKRLNRDGLKAVSFGSDNYSKEEIIAELGNSFLCGKSGIDNNTLKNSSAYIQSWLKNLKEDNKFIFKVVKESQKAVDYILNKEVA